MNKEKIKEFIKKNKVSVGIVGAILSVSILTGVGFGIHKLTSSDNTSLAVAENEENKPNNTIQSDNATASLNEDEQATNDTVEKKNSSENGTENNKTTNDNNSNKATNSENNKKSDEKKIYDKKSNPNSDGKATVTITTDSKGTSSSSSNGTSNGTIQTTNSTTSPSHNNITNTHSHSWTPVKKVVHHKEQGHYENVLVKPAWTEKVPVYEERERSICNGCGKDITSDPYTHNENHMLNGEKGGWHSEWKTVKVGTKTVNHGAVYNKKWVVDKKAYDETIITGYKCSCGATK